MRIELFDYDLPKDRIAQVPVEQRDRSSLMRLDRRLKKTSHHLFCDLPELMQPGDILVVNDTRVVPARLIGYRKTGGKVEILLLRSIERMGEYEAVWEGLARAARGVKEGEMVLMGDSLSIRFVERDREGLWKISIKATMPIDEALEKVGLPPLPPYIQRRGTAEIERLGDRERYQTVYARHPGAVAAPTAGLHFTEALFDAVRERGAEILALTLHVGLGTFQPVRTVEVDQHKMHVEPYSISEDSARRITQGRRQGRRVVAVGTTTVRALETAADGEGGVRSGSGLTELFIQPGYRFQAVDAILTNFHLPKSTLLIMISAFVDRVVLLTAYREAIEQGYRFYSYGDAMLIV